jgi:hypothetical protein
MNELYKDYLEKHPGPVSDRIPEKQIDDRVFRTVEITEDEFELLYSILDPIASKYRGFAKKALTTGYSGSVKGQIKADAWNEKARQINDIISRFGQIFI